MITNYPTPLATWEPEPTPFRPKPGEPAAVSSHDAWRYETGRGSRFMLTAAVAASLVAHLALLFGSYLLPERKAVAKKIEDAPVIRLEIPQLKELEEPEPTTTDEAAPPVDLSVPVPMQSDLPTLPTPQDFVQPLNFQSLLDKPDLTSANLSVIPEQYIRSARIAEKIGKIFNLSDLDRHPEPVLQPAPTYPYAQRRDGLSATVLVEFIVDAEGRVLEPVAVDTTHSAFNDAAVMGVSKWKFRAGVKMGRKVNVRMRVPIHFTVLDSIE